jgi:allantoinase
MPYPISDPPSPTLSPGPITVLASTRAVIGDTTTPATLEINTATGKLAAVHRRLVPRTAYPSGTPYRDVSPALLLPGLVDAHVHLNEPGRTEWEGFWTGTRAAAFGGVTTVVDMPLNAVPPTTTLAGLREKVAAARGKCWVDVGFYGGLVPGNVAELLPLVEAGVRGFKGFLIDSGVCLWPKKIWINNKTDKRLRSKSSPPCRRRTSPPPSRRSPTRRPCACSTRR